MPISIKDKCKEFNVKFSENTFTNLYKISSLLSSNKEELSLISDCSWIHAFFVRKRAEEKITLSSLSKKSLKLKQKITNVKTNFKKVSNEFLKNLENCNFKNENSFAVFLEILGNLNSKMIIPNKSKSDFVTILSKRKQSKIEDLPNSKRKK